MLAPHAAIAPTAHSVQATPPATAASKLRPATAAAPQTKLDQLASALRPDLSSGAKLAIPADVAAGKPGVVSLTLPSVLSDRITAEAGKLGLGHDAQIADVRATLSGAGSSIVPNGVQTARLKSGDAASFNWQVTPAGPNPILSADVGASLKGGTKPQIVDLGQVSAAPPATNDAASNASGGPSTSFQDKPSSAQTGLLILLGLGVLVLVLVLAMVNRVRRDERLAERRRKARAVDEAEAEAAAHHAQSPNQPVADGPDRHTPETV